ncbi:Alpha/Beta hydrolase protein [Cerioporus squamosus]|nr:Alpha/Beta hydrolase protein [Cerioporus squamosus]
MDPEYAAALAANAANAPTAYQSASPTIEELRAGFVQAVTIPHKKYHEERLPPASSYVVEDKRIPGPEGDILVRCVVPVVSDETRKFPVLLWIHGGGGCVGDIEIDDYHLRRISVDLQIVTVNVEYRLAPEHPFPAAHDDCYAALKWTADNAATLKGDLSLGFLIGGHSKGANLAASLAHVARDHPFFEGRQLTGQLLREPAVVDSESDSVPDEYKADYKSMDENGNNPPLSRPVINYFRRESLRPTHVELELMFACNNFHPHYAPLLYPSHEGLPPAYIQVLDLDPLRDDGIIYEKALRRQECERRLISRRYPGVSHGFHMSFPTIKLAEKGREDVLKGLKWLLGREEQ